VDVHAVGEPARSLTIDRGSTTKLVTNDSCPSQSMISKRRSGIVRFSEPRKIAPGGVCVDIQSPCCETRELVVMASYPEELWRLAL
jgi:hypothetical protein